MFLLFALHEVSDTALDAVGSLSLQDQLLMVPVGVAVWLLLWGYLGSRGL